jgi:hypothetical protein
MIVTVNKNVNFDGGVVAESGRGARVVAAVLHTGPRHHQVAQGRRKIRFLAKNAFCYLKNNDRIIFYVVTFCQQRCGNTNPAIVRYKASCKKLQHHE